MFINTHIHNCGEKPINFVRNLRRDSETREVKTLDGIWNFVKSNVSNPTEGIRAKWFEQELSAVYASKIVIKMQD